MEITGVSLDGEAFSIRGFPSPMGTLAQKIGTDSFPAGILCQHTLAIAFTKDIDYSKFVALWSLSGIISSFQDILEPKALGTISGLGLTVSTFKGLEDDDRSCLKNNYVLIDF